MDTQIHFNDLINASKQNTDPKYRIQNVLEYLNVNQKLASSTKLVYLNLPLLSQGLFGTKNSTASTGIYQTFLNPSSSSSWMELTTPNSSFMRILLHSEEYVGDTGDRLVYSIGIEYLPV